jgi:hypothetical protein
LPVAAPVGRYYVTELGFGNMGLVKLDEIAVFIA